MQKSSETDNPTIHMIKPSLGVYFSNMWLVQHSNSSVASTAFIESKRKNYVVISRERKNICQNQHFFIMPKLWEI